MESLETQIRSSGNQESASRDQLITEYLPYVKRIVNRIAIHLPPTVEKEDLYQVGIIGLIQAVDRYDPSCDNKFTTFASYRIRGAVLSELRSRDFLSRQNRKKIRGLDKAYLKLEKKLGREVEDTEVAAEMKIELEELYRIKQISSISFISYEEVGYRSSKDKEKLIQSIENSNDDAFTQTGLNEIKAGIAKAIDKLPQKEKLVLSLYYQDGLTMKEIGKVLEVTESRVSQLRSQAIIHLRGQLRREKLIES